MFSVGKDSPLHPTPKTQTKKDTPQTQKVWVAPMNQSSSEREKWQKPK
ncbi:hypothetical protein H6G98_25150 [Nostoc sp. FACHB-857]|nr:hypothetical protein [Nostoc sp. FACHB-857]